MEHHALRPSGGKLVGSGHEIRRTVANDECHRDGAGEAVSRSLADLRFRDTDMRISEIAARCGYRDANYLKNLFKKRFGMSMREFRNSAKALLEENFTSRAGRNRP